MIRWAYTITAAVTLSLLLGVAALYLSPRDPREAPPTRGEPVRRPAVLTGTAKLEKIIEWILAGKSIKLGQSAWELILAGLKVTLPLNIGGLLLAWTAGDIVGRWIGNRLGRTSGRLLQGLMLGLIVIPHPIQVEVLRSVLVQYGPGVA